MPAPGVREPCRERRLHPPHPLIVATAFLTIALALYANTLRFGYVLDDAAMVRDNPGIRKVDVAKIFGSSAERSYTQGVNDLYRPLGVLSLALSYRASGLDTGPYRLTNILLHGLVSFILYDLLKALLKREGLALLAAVVFLLHPIHTEPVDQIKGRFELLAALFGLLSLRILLARGPLALASGCACFLASMLSKESAIGLLLVFPAADWVRDEALGSLRAMARSLWRQKIKYGLLVLCVAAALGARYQVLGYLSQWRLTNPLDNPIVPEAAPARMLTALKVIPKYLVRLLLPIPLSADYSFSQIPVSRSWRDAGVILGALCVAGWCVGLSRSRTRSPAVFFALFLMGATFLVQSNLLVPIGTIMGERLLYLPSAGYCLLFAVVGVAAAGPVSVVSRQGKAAASLLAISLALMGWRTYDRNLDWESDLSLFRAAYRVSPKSAKVLQALGRAELEEADREKSPALRRERYEKAAAISRDSIEIMPTWRCSRISLAKALIGLDRDDEALRELALVDHGEAKDPEGHYLIGLIALRRGELERAAEEFSLSAHLWPDYAPAAFNLAYAMHRLERYEEASRRYLEAIQAFPDDPRVGREWPRLIESLEQVKKSGSDQASWAKERLEAISAAEAAVSRQAAASGKSASQPPDS